MQKLITPHLKNARDVGLGGNGWYMLGNPTAASDTEDMAVSDNEGCLWRAKVDATNGGSLFFELKLDSFSLQKLHEQVIKRAYDVMRNHQVFSDVRVFFAHISKKKDNSVFGVLECTAEIKNNKLVRSSQFYTFRSASEMVVVWNNYAVEDVSTCILPQARIIIPSLKHLDLCLMGVRLRLAAGSHEMVWSLAVPKLMGKGLPFVPAYDFTLAFKVFNSTNLQNTTRTHNRFKREWAAYSNIHTIEELDAPYAYGSFVSMPGDDTLVFTSLSFKEQVPLNHILAEAQGFVAKQRTDVKSQADVTPRDFWVSEGVKPDKSTFSAIVLMPHAEAIHLKIKESKRMWAPATLVHHAMYQKQVSPEQLIRYPHDIGAQTAMLEKHNISQGDPRGTNGLLFSWKTLRAGLTDAKEPGDESENNKFVWRLVDFGQASIRNSDMPHHVLKPNSAVWRHLSDRLRGEYNSAGNVFLTSSDHMNTLASCMSLYH
jgi:hypothetical protein